jgi:hypothetical protein
MLLIDAPILSYQSSILNGLDPYRSSKEILSNDGKKMNRISTLTNINIRSSDPKDCIDSFYEIFEVIQFLCDNINLYFGKQVSNKSNLVIRDGLEIIFPETIQIFPL